MKRTQTVNEIIANILHFSNRFTKEQLLNLTPTELSEYLTLLADVKAAELQVYLFESAKEKII